MGSKTKKTTQKTELPSWITDASKQAVTMGQNIASREYEGFGGEAIAGLSGNEAMASERARTGFGSASDYFKSGASALGGMQSWADADRSKYMNPYIEDVMRPQLRGVGEAFDSRRAELARTSAQREAFGGGRQTALEAGAQGDYLEQVGDIYGAGYGAAYDQGQRAFGEEQQRKIATAGAFGSLGSGASSVASQQLDALMKTGGTEREIEQAKKNFEIAQFLEKRDWDVNNLQPLLAAIQQAKHGQTTSTKEKTSGGGLSQLAGVAAVVGGTIMTGGTMGAALLAGGNAMMGSGGGE